jgi:WhiB family redox-sensing transcriptional regulator
LAIRRDNTETDWLSSAACRGPEAAAFYPPSSFERKELRLQRERRAKAVCGQCAVRNECLDHALRTGEPHGIWGGLNEIERRDLHARHDQRPRGG